MGAFVEEVRGGLEQKQRDDIARREREKESRISCESGPSLKAKEERPKTVQKSWWQV